MVGMNLEPTFPSLVNNFSGHINAAVDRIAQVKEEVKRTSKKLEGYIRKNPAVWLNRFEVAVYPSDAVEEGTQVLMDNIFTPFSNGVYLHPADYFWYKHSDNPQLAHKMWQLWFEKELDRKVEEANKRIDALTITEEREKALSHVLVPMGKEYIFDNIRYQDHVDVLTGDIYTAYVSDDGFTSWIKREENLWKSENS